MRSSFVGKLVVVVTLFAASLMWCGSCWAQIKEVPKAKLCLM